MREINVGEWSTYLPEAFDNHLCGGGLCRGCGTATRMTARQLDVTSGYSHRVTTTGPVTRVAEGVIFEEMFSRDVAV